MVNAKRLDLFALIRDSALAFGQDKAPRLAAAIAYYAMFSIAPLLLLAVAVAGRFLSNEEVLSQLFSQSGFLVQTLGEKGAEALKNMIPPQDSLQKGTLIATLIGFGTLFLGSTGLFVQIQDALNSMWGADPPPPQGVVNIVKTRLIAFAMIIVIGLLLMVFLGANTYLSAIAQRLGDQLGLGYVAVRVGSLLLSSLFLTPVFAAIYKLLPAVKLEWREVMIGGAITAALFTLGQWLIGLYFGKATPGSAFGAAGSLLALLTWIYYSAMIFFFGAEATWVYSQNHGSRAGGAANTAKKDALAQKGAKIDTRPGQQELEALASAKEPVKDSRGRVLGVPVPPLPRVLPQVPTRAEGRVLPSVAATLWNAVTALFAVPVVIVLRLLGLTGGKRR